MNNLPTGEAESQRPTSSAGTDEPLMVQILNGQSIALIVRGEQSIVMNVAYARRVAGLLIDAAGKLAVPANAPAGSQAASREAK